MTYSPSKIQLVHGLRLACDRSGLSEAEVKPLFRRALLLGDIRAEGRLWRQDSRTGRWDWTFLEPVPRQFFDDNPGSIYELDMLAALFAPAGERPDYDRVPEALRVKTPVMRNGEPELDAAGAQVYSWEASEEGRAILGAMNRPDFERNCTGDLGDSSSQDRIAREIVVERVDVERVFPEATEPGKGDVASVAGGAHADASPPVQDEVPASGAPSRSHRAADLLIAMVERGEELPGVTELSKAIVRELNKSRGTGDRPLAPSTVEKVIRPMLRAWKRGQGVPGMREAHADWLQSERDRKAAEST